MAGLYPNVVRVVDGKPKGGSKAGGAGGATGPPKFFAQVGVDWLMAGCGLRGREVDDFR